MKKVENMRRSLIIFLVAVILAGTPSLAQRQKPAPKPQQDTKASPDIQCQSDETPISVYDPSSGVHYVCVKKLVPASPTIPLPTPE